MKSNVTLKEALQLVRRAEKSQLNTTENLDDSRVVTKWWRDSAALYQWRTKLQAWLNQ